MSEIVDKIQKASVDRLSQMVQKTIASVERQVVDDIGDFKSLSQQANEVLDRFVANVGYAFDDLMDRESIKDEAVFSFENLSLVQEEELEVIVALEGMVNASRNKHLPIFISFNARLSSLFPRKRIDESTNPLDPVQVATAFQEAIRPLGLDAQNSLSVYRAFNAEVLRNMDFVLNAANHVLVESSVLPELGLDGGSAAARRPTKARGGNRSDPTNPFGSIEEEAYEENEDQTELFSIMQNLLHTDSPKAVESAGDSKNAPTDEQVAREPDLSEQFMVPSTMIPAGENGADSNQAGQQTAAMQPFQPQQGQTVQMVDQAKLMEVLTSIQEKLNATPGQTVPGTMDEVEKLDISHSLGEILQASTVDDSVISAVDRQSSDVINLVTLLYEAIWDDVSVPIPIKELIGRTQITIIKVALADVEFFNNENHPARSLLNEFAAAGIGWTEVEELEKDPLYQKIQELVDKVLLEYGHDNVLFEELLADFQSFRLKEAAKTRKLEQRILKASERNDRLDDIHELVTQKVEERILGRELDPFIEELLKGPFYKFMVLLVLKEGPGSNAWKQAINTIDVLLWTVQAHEHAGDRDRLGTVNPRLLNNLRKAFRIASVEKQEVDELIAQLELVQNETFGHEEVEVKKEKVDESLPKEQLVSSDEDAPAKTTSWQNPETAPGVRFLAAGEFEQDKEKTTESVTEDSAERIEALPAEAEPASTLDSSADAPVEAAAASSEEAELQEEIGDESTTEPEDLSEDSPYMLQVDSLGVGMWVEFAGEDDITTRCKLAAKINAIDKFIFVNRQGVKVVEKTKMGLAIELRDGTVSIVSDGLLFSRALESVIGNLRDTQHEQQTGSAFQPAEEA